MKITELYPADVRSGDTRDAINSALSYEDRVAFSNIWDRKITGSPRYQVKYWPHDVLMAACNKFGVAPVLTQQGADRVKAAGNRLESVSGALFDSKGLVVVTDENGQRIEQKGVVAYTEPAKAVTVPGGQPEPQVVAEKSRAISAIPEDADARRAKLIAIIDQRLDEGRKADAEGVKQLIANVAASSAGAAVDVVMSGKADELARKVESELAKALETLDAAKPQVLEIRVGGKDGVIMKGRQHKVFAEVLQIAALREEIALIGPTGSGKTHIARQVAEGLGFDLDTQFGTISCSAGMSESKLIGGLLPTGEGGKFEPFVTDFVRIFRDGGLFLLDEWDAADENVALVINQAVANGSIDLMGLGRVKRHETFVLMVAMNTFGTGANRMYVGRNQMDEATLDRFRMGQIEMDYDREMERELVESMGGSADWLRRCWAVRDKINADAGIRRNLSTRFILKGVKMQQGAGWSIDKCFAKLTMGWADVEKQKVGIR